MSPRYRKTDTGRAEIRERKQALSRPARNLLLIIDDSRTGEEWLSLVAGVNAAELQALIDNGFVEAVSAPPPPPASAPRAVAAPAVPAAAPAAEAAPAALALDAASYRSLYDYLTAQARPRLGLIKGYRAVLDIERSTDLDALKRYAEHFVDLVREAQGDAAAGEVARTLTSLR